MSRIERYGRYLALAALMLLWPVIDAYQSGAVTGPKVGVYGGLAVVYVATYSWFCLFGSKLRGPQAAILTVASLTGMATVLNHLSGRVDHNFYLIPMMVAGFSLRTRMAVTTLVAVSAVTMLDGILLLKTPSAQAVFQAALVIPIAVLFGGGGMGLRYLLATVSELRAARAEVAGHAAEQERTRIARDLHDLLGHNLSLITLKGELATRLLPEGTPGSDEVRDMVGLSREALQQVREVVSGYRQPTLATELRAARVALDAAGIEAEIAQSVGALDRDSEAVLGWVVREATTNLIRHSGAKHCRIILTRTNGQITAEVVNDGWRVPATPAGNGLRGLQERLSSFGGSLEASALPDAGFKLLALLPMERVSTTAIELGTAR